MWRGGGVNQKHLLDFCRYVQYINNVNILIIIIVVYIYLILLIQCFICYILIILYPKYYIICRHVAAGDWCHIFPEAGVWQTTQLGK
jgi:hypothetical protein